MNWSVLTLGYLHTIHNEGEQDLNSLRVRTPEEVRRQDCQVD